MAWVSRSLIDDASELGSSEVIAFCSDVSNCGCEASTNPAIEKLTMTIGTTARNEK